MAKSKYTKRGSWTTKKVVRRRSAASSRTKAARVTTVSEKRKALINVQALPPVERGKEIHFRSVVIGSDLAGSRTTGVPIRGVSGSEALTSLMTLIAQGSGVQQRAGRVIKLRRLTLNYTVSSGYAGYGANCRVCVVFDKRPERQTSLQWSDVFTSENIAGSMINATIRENRDGSFEVLYDKTTFVEGGRPRILAGTYFQNAGGELFVPDLPSELNLGDEVSAQHHYGMVGRNAVAHKEVIDLSAKRFYTQYDYQGTTGSESDHEYGAMHLFAWSDIDHSAASSPVVPRMCAQYEVEFLDY